MLPVSLDCSFLIALSVFSNVYLNVIHLSPTHSIDLANVRLFHSVIVLTFQSISFVNIFLQVSCIFIFYTIPVAMGFLYQACYIIKLLPKRYIIWLSNLLILSVPDEGYSRNASCALNLISTFLFILRYVPTLFLSNPLGPITSSNICFPSCESSALSGSSRR